MNLTNDYFAYNILRISCLTILNICLVGAVLNMALGLDIILTVLISIFSIMSFLCWYFLKNQNNFKPVRLLTTIWILVLLNITWYFNYSSHGPILFLFVLYSMLIVFMWPIRNAAYIMAFVVLNIILLYYVEVNYSDLILNYNSDYDRINDFYFGVLASVSLAISLSYYAKTNYLKKYNEANRANELKTLFLQNMSHELRTPLNSIIGFSGLINNNLPNEKAVDYAKIVNNCGHHLLGLVNDLMDISMIDSGHIKIEKKDVCLHELLDSVYNVMDADIQKTNKKIQLELILPTEIKQTKIYSDPLRLKQILFNLLRNSLKFTTKGSINFGYRLIDNEGDLSVQFHIQDTGIGIPEEMKEFVFDAFRQVEESTTKSFGGTGVGLYISKRMAELLGGTIWFNSVEGKGSNFYFSLPQVSEVITISSINDTVSSKEDDTVSQKMNCNVLVAEDEEYSYELLQILLDDIGIKTHWAKNGKEAIEFCKVNDNISLILMDINMPVMNGLVATQEIKKFRPHIPIVAQTAFAISGDRERSIEAGCDDYITKPIDPQKLRTIILNYCNYLAA